MAIKHAWGPAPFDIHQNDGTTREPLLTNGAKLFGDYERIIDVCLGGDPKIKRRVAEADADGRRGWAVIKYHIAKCKVSPPARLIPILETCENDQAYYDGVVKTDMRNIEVRGSKFRATVCFEGVRHRRTFGTIEEGRRWRDLAQVLFWTIAQDEALEDRPEKC